MNDSKFLFEVMRDPEGDFSCKGYDVVPLGGNRVRIKGEE